MTRELPTAEELGHYWKTGTSSAETWIDKARAEIERAGGTVVQEAFGREGNRAAFMLAFEMDNANYKLVYPVLASKAGNESAAKRQAATMMYHDVKAKCVMAKAYGSRLAFFAHLVLPDGRIAHQVAAPELAALVPKMLQSGE